MGNSYPWLYEPAPERPTRASDRTTLVDNAFETWVTDREATEVLRTAQMTITGATVDAIEKARQLAQVPETAAFYFDHYGPYDNPNPEGIEIADKDLKRRVVFKWTEKVYV